MSDFFVPCGDTWQELTGKIRLPEQEIMRIKTYLNGMNPDDLVYTRYWSAVVGAFDEGEIVDRLIIVGKDGAGRRLRRHEFKESPSRLLDDVASIYLCTVMSSDGHRLRYVFVDCQDEEHIALVCLRKDFSSVYSTLKMGGNGGGNVWKGSRMAEASKWTELDESQFSFPDGLVSAIDENTSQFLTGNLAAQLVAWGVAPKRGIILFGKPGNGKTVLSRITAKHALEAGINIVFLDSRSLHDDVGQQLALAASRDPVIIIIDDLDIHCGHRVKTGEPEASTLERQRFLADLLEFLDGVMTTQGYVLLVTTNALEELDAALLRAGRLDVHVHVGGPTEDHRRRILKNSIGGTGVPVPNLSTAVTLLDGCTYADVSELSRRYKIAVVAKYGCIESDQQLLDSVASSYAHEIGLLQTSTTGFDFTEK